MTIHDPSCFAVSGRWSPVRGSPRSPRAEIAGALGYANANGGIPWILLIIQIVVAAIGVVIAANLYARRGTTHRP